MFETLSTSIVRSVVLAATILTLNAGSVSAQSAGFAPVTELPDAFAPYPLRSRGLDIQDGLRLFAKNLRVGIVVDEGIAGEITAELSGSLSRRDYLDELAALYDFVWYFDGQVLRVSPVGDIEIKIIPLSENSGGAIIDMLQRLGLYQPKFTHRADQRSRVLMVSGPSSYIEMVQQVADAVEEAERTNITLLRGEEGGMPSALDSIGQIDSNTGLQSSAVAQE